MSNQIRGQDTNKDTNKEDTKENVMVSHGETVFMQTANAEVRNPETTSATNTRLLLDCGSQRTYVTETLVKRLNIKTEGTEELRVFTFGKADAKVIKTPIAKIDLKLKNGNNLNIQANVVPVISGNIQRKTLNVFALK